MEVSNQYPNSEFMAQFLAKQDLPKPATNPLLHTPAKEDSFVASKDNSQHIEAAAVKSDDTFVKSETAVQPAPAEEIKDELSAQEVNEAERAEEVNEEAEIAPAEEIKDEAPIGANVTKKATFIDKIKGFLENLFIKLKPRKSAATIQKNCAGGGTN